MKPAMALLVWQVAGLVVLLPVGMAAAAEPRLPSPLAGVKALEKPVTFTETKIPLGELVQKVAADTGVKLVALPEVADEPVAVVVKDLPARELLEQLAELLDYMWSRRGKEGDYRYEIWQDVAARNREEALRQAALADVQRRLGEEVRRFAQVAALPPQKIQALAEESRRWRENLFKLPPAQRPAIVAKEGRQMEQAATAHRLRSPVNRTLALFLGRLSPEQWAVLRQGRPLHVSTDPQPGEQLLPEEAARAFRSARPSMDDSWRYGDPETAEKERQKQRNMEAEWTAASGYRVSLRLDAKRFQRHGTLGLHAYATPLQPKAGPASAYAYAEGTSLQLYSEPTQGRSQAEDDSPERRAAMEKDPLLGARKRFKRQPAPRPDPNSPRNRSFTTLQDLLPDLARSFDLNVIADSYSSDRSGFPIPAEELSPAYVLLDRATQYGYRWERKGDLVRIRHRAWFFARPKEVPHRIVRRWNEFLAGGSEPPLEEYAAAAAGLNDDQLELLPGMLRRGDTLFVHDIFPARHALRLYASLNPLQQQALRQGQPVPVTAMTPAQRDLFLASWRERQQAHERGEPSAESPVPPVPPLGPASSFTMEVKHLRMTAEKKGEMTHFRWEPATAPAPGTPASGAASTGAAVRPSPSTPPRSPNITRRTLTQVSFQFRYNPDLQDHAQVNVAHGSARVSRGAEAPGAAASQKTQP